MKANSIAFSIIPLLNLVRLHPKILRVFMAFIWDGTDAKEKLMKLIIAINTINIAIVIKE